jgi:hypothetical protein
MDAAERQRAGNQEDYYCAGSQAIEFLRRLYDLEIPRCGKQTFATRIRSAIEFWLFGRDVLIGIDLVGGV